MKVVINGAGIAGTTLAYWLVQSRHEVLLVEAAPRLRRGGYLIDFWGGGYDIAERMGLIPQVRALGYQMREVRYVDEHGRRTGGFSVDVFGRMTNGRFTSVRRSDLAATIYGAISGRVETLFGDSIAGCEALGDRVRTTFDRSPPRDVDLVVGADGLHSRVRTLVFGPEEAVEVDLGYQVAAFEVAGYRPREELVAVNYAVPGRQVSRLSLRDDKTLFLFVFHDEYLRAAPPTNDEERKAALRSVFSSLGWECPQALDVMQDASDIYFDRVSQIRMNEWAKGRVALIGDAAACVSLLAGEGTGLAMMEAYVLAGALQRCGGDLGAAFARYQELMKQFLERKQRSAAQFASAFAPRTATGIRLRNLVTKLFRIPFVAEWFVGGNLRDDITLPNYDAPDGDVRVGVSVDSSACTPGPRRR
jgi:2-polyprenyl-6-methoxyphenol hydroxylase-like FAD-dependent oxidoreductase